jgi:hypothetical protein
MAQATNSTLGTIALSGDLSGTANSPELSPTGVKAGAYENVSKLHIDSKGRTQWAGKVNWEADIKPVILNASPTDEGILAVGPKFSVSSGVLSVPYASSTTFGIIKVGFSMEVNQSTGAVDVVLPNATYATKGAVQVGSGFDIAAGVLSRSGWNDASTTVKGFVKAGANFNIDYGVLSVPYASSTTFGVASIDSTHLYIDTGSNTLYPHAAHTQLWGMVYGWSSDFSLNGSGQLCYTSPYTAIPATASTLGFVKIGNYLYMDGNDALTVAKDASTSEKGLVEPGTGFSVSSGSISAGLASSSTWGLLCIGVTNDTLMSYNTTGINSPGYPEDGTTGLRFRRCDIAAQNLAYPGVVRSGNMDDIAINNGVMDIGVNIPRKDSINTYTKAQITGKSTFVDTDWSRGNMVEILMNSNVTSIPAPINAVPGQILTIIVTQDATGGRTMSGWNSVYKFNGTLTLSTAPNATDLITIICKSTTEFYVLASKGYI